jgi:hypothetical protein
VEKATRAQLLRERFKAKCGLPYVGEGRTRKPERQAQPWFYSPLPAVEPNTKRAPGWVKAPLPKPKTVPRTKRNEGVPVLTRIAEKAAPKKLKRRHATAEGLLSERKQQSRP